MSNLLYSLLSMGIPYCLDDSSSWGRPEIHLKAFDQHIQSVNKCFLKYKTVITCHNITAAIQISDDSGTCLEIS